MIINVTDDYRIISDSDCWTVQERTVAGENARVPGRESWHARTYHPTLFAAGRSLAETIKRNSDAIGYDDARRAFREINQFVADIVRAEEEAWK